MPDDVVVENVHLSESLMRLSYRVCNMQEKSDAEDTKKEYKESNRDDTGSRNGSGGN